MIDEFAKGYLHDALRSARRSLLATLDGLSEFDARRPLTGTGTNVLGLLKHLSITEARYLGEVVGRPLRSVSLPRFEDPGYHNRDHLWVRPEETRADIVAAYQRAGRHADETIDALPIDAPGLVPWWPRPQVMLFNVLVHVLIETSRHAGHADILREQSDGAFGSPPAPPADPEDWARHRARVEQAARLAGGLD